jgi:hypothetical protein
MPSWLANAPVLELGLQLYIEAFFELHAARPVGMEEGMIPWAAIWDYCERLEIVDDQKDDMFHHIHQMDLAYREFRSRKRG